MKKTYFAPVVELSKMDSADIIATSAFDEKGNGVQLAGPDFVWEDDL